jgi:hypothetical protein
VRPVAWAILDGHGEDVADIEIAGERLIARGRAANDDPVGYALTYDLVTGPRFVTQSLGVEVELAGSRRRLVLERSTFGRWSAALDGAPLELPELDDALDCDLGRCPTTNSMPVLREGLLERDGAVDFVMAWVQVPELLVRRSAQRYVPLGMDDRGLRRIRFVSLDSDFESELTFDSDGLVVDYPGLARRITG